MRHLVQHCPRRHLPVGRHQMLDQPALEKRLCLTAQGRFPGRTGLEWLRLALAGSVTAMEVQERHDASIPPSTRPRAAVLARLLLTRVTERCCGTTWRRIATELSHICAATLTGSVRTAMMVRPTPVWAKVGSTMGPPGRSNRARSIWPGPNGPSRWRRG